jgi:GH3 auxin-responsive promoter
VAVEEPWRELTVACRDADLRFVNLCAQLEGVQRAFLRDLLARSADTAFGQAHRFEKIADYSDFAASVPIGTYEAFAPFIDASLRGDARQLTTEPVLFVETTGGSTSGAKIIPYTAGALEAYARAMLPWLANLMRERRLFSGRIYFALSPAGRRSDAMIGTLRLGSPQRFAYFGAARGPLAALSIAPPALSSLSDFETWSFATCLHLLAADDLALIWIWSPTFLLELIWAMQRMKRALLETLRSGRLPEATLGTCPLPAPNASRAADLDGFLDEGTINTAAIWPRLDTISCWMDGASAPFAAALKAVFPRVRFQPKGLMLTEGAVTLPFGDGPGAPLALESGFFEFVDGDEVRL